MFQYVGKIPLIGILTLALIDAIWIISCGYSLYWETFFITIIQALYLLLAVYCFYFAGRWFTAQCKAYDTSRKLASYCQNLTETMLFFVVGWVVLRLYNHLSMTTTFPYADTILATWDQALFGVWNDYFAYVAESPRLIRLLDTCYTGLGEVSVAGFLLLYLSGRTQQARFFFITFIVTAVLATTIGMFFPARAAVDSILENKDLISNFSYPPGTYHIEILERLRSQSGLVFDVHKLPGLTTFPSFHTASGILLIYAFRQSVFFIPVLAYSIIMIASTPVFGGHYFVDLIAGAALAWSVCWCFEKRPEFDGLFKNRTREIQRPSTIAISASDS